MSNILNHSRNIFDLKLDFSDYWDFHVCLDNQSYVSDVNNQCKAVDIDFNNDNCIWFDKVMSKPDVTWSESINKGLVFNSIGYTGMDNGLISFEKDKITNKEFMEMFVNSSYSIEENDTRLTLNKVKGNNQIFDYDSSIVFDDDKQVLKLNGGFYQGFFKTDCNYQVLPDTIDSNWTFDFELKRENGWKNDNSYTLNDKHPENRGIFFFLGTRAENKWYEYYKTEIENGVDDNRYSNSDYTEDFIAKVDSIIEDYIKEDKEEAEGNYFADDYVSKKQKDKYFDENSNCCNFYVGDEYIESDVRIDENLDLKTSEGYDLYQPNIIEIKTDNKFITHNRTKDGFTVKDDIEDAQVILHDVKVPDMENYFTLFDRTCKGYTTRTIQSLIDEKSKKYVVLDDLYNNALCFQIKDNGEVGYKYLVKDCENNTYKIESEFSKFTIKNDEWCKVKVKMSIVGNKMRIIFYVNNKLVLVSKPLGKLNLRPLNDLPSKQEGVAYNLSLGGGTQGLCDRVSIDYMKPPVNVLPIEKEFAGTFIGFIKSFQFSVC